MAVGGLGVSGGPIKLDPPAHLVLSSLCRVLLRSARGRRGAVPAGEPLLADLLRAPPRCGVPDLDVVEEADDDDVAFEAGKVPQTCGDGDPALAVGAGLHGAGEERPLHVTLALPGPISDLARLHVELL